MLPTVVQDARDGTVLIVAYSTPGSWEELRRTGELVLFSRSRQRLWRKGETSGNTAKVLAASLDCDADALLVKVLPRGPMCHTGTRGCFGEMLPLEERQMSPTLFELQQVVDARRRGEGPKGSYTRKLLADEAKRLKKVGEEAAELIVAAAQGDRAQVRWEAADLLYHTTVALAAAGVDWGDILEELAARASRGAVGRVRPGRTSRKPRRKL